MMSLAFTTAFNRRGIDSYKLYMISMVISFHALRIEFHKSQDDVILNWSTYVFRIDNIFVMTLVPGDFGG